MPWQLLENRKRKQRLAWRATSHSAFTSSLAADIQYCLDGNQDDISRFVYHVAS
jgi:hypothetical protein